MKNSRQAKILEIISEKSIETQAQLMQELKKAGINSTQATLSRDIKQLSLVKEQTLEGIYCYRERPHGERFGNEGRLRTIFREGAVSFDTAQNIVVIKTLPGLASAVASAIDAMDIIGAVGTIAGDDTLFLAMRDNDYAQNFCEELQSML